MRAARSATASSSTSVGGADGERQQYTATFDHYKDARSELSRIRHELDAGTHVPPSELTVNEYLDGYDEVGRCLAKLSEDRLFPAWRLTLYGLRRGEVLGLRWSDLDLYAKEVTISQARIMVDYRVVVNAPKSENGIGTLLGSGRLRGSSPCVTPWL